jgi:uncharacterized protein YbcI
MDYTELEKEISGYIGRILRGNFGRGPGNVFCTISSPFVSIYITNFLSPMENTLISNKQSVYVQKTRDLMMETLEEQIKSFIQINTKDEIKEFYYDWNLEAKSGMFLFIFKNDRAYEFEHFNNQELIERETVELSMKIQKAPDETRSKLLNERTLVIVRHGILISLEKEFIQLGFQETLKIAKRNLEKKAINHHRNAYEKYLNAEITDYFVDWNFEQDKSYTLFTIRPK